MVIPDPIPAIATPIPPQVKHAAKACDVAPADLLSWAAYADRTVIVLPSGQKITFPME